MGKLRLHRFCRRVGKGYQPKACLLQPQQGAGNIGVRFEAAHARYGVAGIVPPQADTVRAGNHLERCDAYIGEIAVAIAQGGYERILQHGGKPEPRQVGPIAQRGANAFGYLIGAKHGFEHVEKENAGTVTPPVLRYWHGHRCKNFRASNYVTLHRFIRLEKLS